MSDSSQQKRDIIEHAQEQQRKYDQKVVKEVIQETIEECSRALTRNEVKYYLYVAKKCERVLAPLLIEDSSRLGSIALLQNHPDAGGWTASTNRPANVSQFASRYCFIRLYVCPSSNHTFRSSSVSDRG